MDDKEDRLSKAVAERTRLSGQVQRLNGRKEAAQKALAEVEAEIRERGLDPEKLDETIVKLDEALENELKTLEKGLAEARQALQPFLELS